MTRPKVLGVIMARGGSRSVPKKSIALCAGKPLLYYTIEAAKRSALIDRLIISTDDAEMAAVAQGFGVDAPFMRPKELADHDTLDIPVIDHALTWLEENENYVPEIVVHLRPTTPLKKSTDIDRGISLLINNPAAHSARSVCEPIYTPFKMYRGDAEEGAFLEPIMTSSYPDVYEQFAEPHNMPRQKLPRIWRHSGYVDVIRAATIKQGSISGTKILALPFETWRDIDIDTPRDLRHAELVIHELREKGRDPWD